MKGFILFVCVLVMTGCAAPTDDIDIKNSPCACNYDGEQLYSPTKEEKKEWFEYYQQDKERFS